jgi:O-antigen/teichoic acid export membrane protein
MKNTFLIILLGRVFQVFMSFVTLKVVTNYLSKDSVAYYFLVLSVLNYFGLSLISPAGQYFNRKIHYWKENRVLMNRIFNHFLYVFSISIIAIPITYIASHWLGLMSGVNSANLALLVGAGVLFNTLITTVVPTFNMLNHRIAYVMFTSLWLTLSLAFSVTLIKLFGENIILWFAGQVLSQIIVSVITLAILIKYTNEAFSMSEALSIISKDNIKQTLKFIFPLMVSTLLMWVATDSFRFVLEKTHGLEYLGMFSVGFAIAQRFSYAIESIAQQVFFPTFYEKINLTEGIERSQAWLELFYSAIPLYLCTTIFTIIFSGLLIKIFSGPQYYEAKIFVISGAVFHLFRKLTATFAMGAHSEMKTSVLIPPYMVGAIFSSIILYLSGKGSALIPTAIIPLGGLAMFAVMVYMTRNVITFKWCYETARKSVTGYFKR